MTASSPSQAAADKPLLTFITTHTVQHDNVTYPPGSEFSCADPQVIKQLRAAHAIALREELDKAEDVAVRVARLEAEKAALLEELDALKAAMATVTAEASAEKPAGKAAAK